MNQTFFTRHVHYMYHKIDKSSNLLWSHENHITEGTKKRKRGEQGQEEKQKWVNFETTQIGYGEISAQAITDLLNWFQNVDVVILDLIKTEKLKEEDLAFDISDYCLDKNSLFLDIGSGFGKPVWHCAFQVGCKCLGIEVVPARVEFCWDFYYEFLENKDFFRAIKEEFAKGKDENVFEQRRYIKKVKHDYNLIYFDFGFYNEMFVNDVRDNNYTYEPLITDCAYLIDDIKSYCHNKDFIVYHDILRDRDWRDNIPSKYFLNKNKNKTIQRSILCPATPTMKFGNKFLFIQTMTTSVNTRFSREWAMRISNNIHHIYQSFPMNLDFYPSNPSMLELWEYSNIVLSNIVNDDNESRFQALFDKDKNESAFTEIEKRRNCFNGNKKNNKEITTVQAAKATLTCGEYNEEFYKNIKFILKDATKLRSYKDENKDDYTHIYSYNKWMSETCRKKSQRC